MRIVFYLHLLGAAVWVGGLIVMSALAPAVRRATEDRSVISAMAQRFGVVSWIALGALVLTGAILAFDSWSQTLTVKVGLTLVVALLAAWHSVMGRAMTSRTRGVSQGLILVLSLVILWAAIGLDQ